MNALAIAVLMLTLAAAPALAAETAGAPTLTQAASPATPIAAKGKMLIAANGERLGAVYKVDTDGPEIILEGRMVTVPANTLSVVGGRLTTSMTKNQITALP